MFEADFAFRELSVHGPNGFPFRLQSEFWEFYHPPQRIWAQGNIDLLARLPSDGFAVVGTREPQVRSLQWTRQWIRGLSGTKRVIVSGFARGIDRAAHEAALEAGLPTIGIVAGGLDLDYPRGHSKLRRRILESGGLMISEYEPGTDPIPARFHERNRLIAAWSRAVLVVEAGKESGALNTAKWARDFHRATFAVPCSPGDPAFFGNQILLDAGGTTAFWGTHSLGSVWIDLSARKQGSKRASEIVTGDEAELFRFVRQQTHARGGVEVGALLNWSLELNWTPARYFEALKKLLENDRLVEVNGLILKNPEDCD